MTAGPTAPDTRANERTPAEPVFAQRAPMRREIAPMIRRLLSLPAQAKRLADRLTAAREYRRFLAEGQKPWTPGYHLHKQNSILAAATDATWDPHRLPPRHGWRLDERIVEYPWFFRRLPECAGALLDAGSILNYAYILDNPKLTNKELTICTLAPEGETFGGRPISYVYGDLRDTYFKNDAFDWVVCLSTLEHVGFDNTMLYTTDASKQEHDPTAHLDVVRELRRILRGGGKLYLSVPFGKSVNHGWFQVFDSEGIDRVIEAFSPGAQLETVYQYLPDGWVVSDRGAAADALFFDIHKQNTYDHDYAAASRAVVCLEMTK
ncbi:MAG: methyltransferase domain-containing protein [bacterium]